MNTHQAYSGHQSHKYQPTIPAPELQGFLLSMWSVKGYMPHYVETGKAPSEESMEWHRHQQREAVPCWHFLYRDKADKVSAEIITVPSHGMEFLSLADFYTCARKSLGGGLSRAITTLPYAT